MLRQLRFFYRYHLVNTISLLNIAALSIGFGACLLILNFVSFELSFDSFHTKSDRIYRATWQYGENASTTRLQPIFGEQIPYVAESVKSSVRFFEQDMTVSKVSDMEVVFNETNFIYTDNSFFEIFDFKLSKGAESGFRKPYSAVISNETAAKYFGDQNPIGEAIRVTNMFGDGIEYTVQGVFDIIPENSHLRFGAILTNERLFSQEVSYMGIQSWGAFPTYLLLESAVQKENVEELIAEEVKKYGEDFNGSIQLQPLADIHLRSADFRESNNSQGKVATLAIVALIILILAWVNYINLSTARSLERAKEVGIRKILGSEKTQILKQFVFETVMINAIALIAGLAIMKLTSGPLSYLTGLNLNSFDFGNPSILLLSMLVFSTGTLLSGIAPALAVSRFKIMDVVSGKLKHTKKGIWTRRILLGGQFSISLVLLIITVIIFRQVQYMTEKSAGANISETLVVSTPTIRDDAFSNTLTSFVDDLKSISWFEGVSISNSVPGMGFNYATSAVIPNTEIETEVSVTRIDESYIKHYDLSLIEGSNFNSDLNNSNKIIVNRKFLSNLNIPVKSAIDQEIIVGQTPKQIIGVVENYHHRSMHDPYESIVFEYGDLGNAISIKVSPGREQEALSTIQEKYTTYFAGNPFDFVFLDSYFATNYTSDWQIGRLLTFFTALAVIIAAMGLFGYTSLSIVHKTKEIGIRKVLGASSISNAYILSREYLVVLMASVIISIPIGSFISTQILQQYAFQVSQTLLTFVLPVTILLTILALTITAQVIKSVVTNPVDSLRYE